MVSFGDENSDDIILLNSSRSCWEQNFDCTHEMLHLILHRKDKGQVFFCTDTVSDKQYPIIEWQANEGAAELLVPYQDFIPRFANLLRFNAVGITSLLAEYYYVTTKVISNRIDNLAYEIDQYRAGRRIDQIKLLSHRQLKRIGITPTCYKAVLDFALDWDSEISCY